MLAILDNLNSGDTTAVVIALAGICGGVLIAVTVIIAHHWKQCRKAELDTALKQEMLHQGKSVEEIERVLRAGDPHLLHVPPVGEIMNHEELVRFMTEKGYEDDGIAAIIRLLKTGTGTPTERQREAQMIRYMLEEGKETEGIEAVVKASRSSDDPQAPLV